MSRQPDIRYATGAIHDECGPITSFVAETPAGQQWLVGWAGQRDSYIIESEMEDQIIGCIEGDGLRVVHA